MWPLIGAADQLVSWRTSFAQFHITIIWEKTMESEVSRLVQGFESGKIDRRQLVAGLGSLVALASLGQSAQAQDTDSSTFEATELNHIALRVTDVLRSRQFYERHLGMKVLRDGGQRNCFMSCGEKNFVALFQGEEASMDHYCYSIKNFDVGRAEAKLKAEGIEPRVVRDAGRIYFPDPDGLTVQLAASDHRP
jgi:catechol 2,3-dioxygenase-like lactoylglutathione lyase family enzyme